MASTNKLYQFLLSDLKLFISVAIVAFAIVIPAKVNAQKDCDKTLEQAKRYYEIGQIEKVPSLLEPCIENGFNKDQKTEAYQLMVLTYQFDNRPVEAEQKFKELLKHDPEFSVNEENASGEMMQLYNTYHAPPIYSIGIIAGVNSAMAQRTQSFGLSNAEKNLSDYSSNGFGFQVGATVKKYISKKFELNIDFLYQTVKYQRKLNQLGFSDILYTESQSQFNVPLSLTFDKEFGRFSPYIRLGGGLSYMFGSDATVERVYNSNSIENLPNITGPAINILGQRNNVNFFSVVGAGIFYKVPRGMIMLDFRHNWNFLQQNRPSKRYENNVLVYEYHYLDDDFKLGNVAMSIGYTYSFHKIKIIKKKKVTTDE